MNKVWAFMILAGIGCFAAGGAGGAGGGAAGETGAASGSAGFTAGLLESCEEAVYFVIGLAGIMGLWSGFMNVAKGSGLIHALAERCRPAIKMLFPDIQDEETIMLMLMGFTANVFGAGNSATVFSLQAMKKLDEQNLHREEASNAMCMFAAVNMSMLQLVPITVIQIRAAAGSASSSDIIMPSVIAGAAATAGSAAVCRICEKRRNPLKRHFERARRTHK